MPIYDLRLSKVVIRFHKSQRTTVAANMIKKAMAGSHHRREELLGLESKESQARVHLVQLPSDDESWKNLIKISSRVEGLVRKISSKEGNGRIVWLRRHDVLSVWLRRCIGRISSSRV